MNIYEGARRTRSYVRTGTNHGDDGNPVPQFLVSKTYLGGKKNISENREHLNKITASIHGLLYNYIYQLYNTDVFTVMK